MSRPFDARTIADLQQTVGNQCVVRLLAASAPGRAAVREPEPEPKLATEPEPEPGVVTEPEPEAEPEIVLPPDPKPSKPTGGPLRRMWRHFSGSSSGQ